MAAIAFDIGDCFCKIGVAKSKTLGVMQNQVGKRKTSSVVAFTQENRLFDQEATAQALSNSKNTCTSFKSLIGKKFNDPDVQKEKPFVKQAMQETKDGGVGLQVKYLGKNTVVTPTQVAASLMVFLKEQAEKGLDSKLPECVIGCPPYWTEVERLAFLDAAKLAGINVSRLMNETTAVALDYGINLELAENSSKKSIFIDVGHSSVNVCAVEFWRKTGRVAGLKVLSTASAPGIGGRSFSQILFKYFAEQIKSKYKLDVSTNQKAMSKLARTCEKIKTNLTANNKVPFGIEYLMNDQDVSGSIDRKDFESAAQPILTQMMVPIKKVLEETGLTASDLSTVEAVGGGCRIPCVKKAIKEFVGKELSFHCDADESCAKGLVLQAAMLSPSFRTREYQVVDICQQAIEVAWGPMNGDEEDKTLVFGAKNSIPSTKLISFNERTQPFRLSARYVQPPPGVAAELANFTVTGFPKKLVGEKAKVKVWMKLNIHGTVEIANAQLVETLPVEEEPAMEVETPDEAKKEEEKKEEAKKDEAKKDESKKEEEKKEEAATDKEPKAEGGAEKKEKKPKKKYHRTELKIASSNLALSADDYKMLEQIEAEMSSTDRLVLETQALRNDLEQYVLEMRGKVRGELKSYLSPEASTKFLEELQNAEYWIEDEGWDAQKSTLKKKLDELKVTGDPIFQRQYEYTNGTELINRLKTTIGKYRQLASSKDEKYAHIESKDMESIVTKCNDFDNWATDMAVKFGNAKRYENPPILCSAIKAKQKELVDFAQPILSKPKPQPKKEEKKEEAKEEGKKEEAKKEEAKADGDKMEEEKSGEEKSGEEAKKEEEMDLD